MKERYYDYGMIKAVLEDILRNFEQEKVFIAFRQLNRLYDNISEDNDNEERAKK